MDKIKKYSIVFVVLCVFCLISNSVVFVNYIKQQQVVVDIERFPPTLSSDKITEFDLKYPNINIYVVPFKTYLGRLYLRDSMYEKAIEAFHKGRKNNPNLMINENYLADVYKEINVKDSFEYYTSKAFKKMPNHPAHFGRYLEMLDEKGNSYKIDSIFNSLSYKSETMWKIYLSAISPTKTKSELAHENFKTARKRFPKDIGIGLAIDYNLYGYDDVEKAKKFEQVSDAFSDKGDFQQALIALQKATPLHPYNKYYEKLATLSYKLKNFKSTVSYLDSIDKTVFFDEGRYYLVKGISLIQLNDKESGCEHLTQSIFKGNKEALKAKNVFCRD